jgi:hypothetical protein
MNWLPFVSPKLGFHGSVAIVGSSGILLNNEHGKVIDRFTDVIRFNRAPADGYEQFVGSKETIRVVNNHVFNNHPISEEFSSQLISFVGDLRNSRILLICPGPGPADKRTHKSNKLFIFDGRPQAVNRLMKQVGFECEEFPSIGTVFICLSVNAGIRPYLFGFDTDVNSDTRSHYWENRPNTSQHKISYEKRFIKALHNDGKVVIR